MKLLLSLLLTTSAYAATTGTLLIKGIVPAILSIEIAPEAISTALALETTQVDLLVAVVTERSNNSAGYKTTISSANLSKLMNGSEEFNYTMKYNGNVIDLSAPVEVTSSFTSAAPVNKNLQISYTGVPLADLKEGEYTDELTLTISAN